MKKNTYLNDLTQAELKQRLHYSPGTGIFTWKKLPVPDPSGRYSNRGANIFNAQHAGVVAGRPSRSGGYRFIRLYGALYRAHRLIFLYMTGSWPAEEVDHINHNRADNRWKNLRECTRVENGKNVSLSSNNTSGVTGVIWCPYINSWVAQITILGTNRHLGYFKNFDDAVAARKAAEIKYNFHPNHGI